MSRFTPKDASLLMEALVKQATGQDNIAEVNSSNFVSMGETVLATGMENTLNALSVILGKTIIASRSYSGNMRIIQAQDSGEYTTRFRKISYYSQNPQEAGDWNTDININLRTGFDNGSNGGSGTASMWEQHPEMPLELNFAGSDVWQEVLTRYKYQVKKAFRSPEEFANFVNGFVTEKKNDIESQKEAYRQMCVLNMIGAIYNTGAYRPYSKVNLTKEFNDKFGTSYTSEELRTTHLADFLKFFTSTFKIYSRRMAKRSTNYHWSVPKTVGTKTYHVLRHTPKEMQRTLLYAPLFIDAEAQVFPEIFHEDYLFDPSQHELVDYWQSINDPSAVNITPAIPDIANNSATQIEGEVVNIPYVVGILYDRDAMMIDYQLEDAETTPMEARKRYYNIWWSFAKNVINDLTENAILFYMEDSDEIENVQVAPVNGEAELFGHVVSTFQSDVSVSNGRILGTLKFIEGGLAESGPLAGDGYFLALQFSATDWSDYDSVKVGLKPSQGTGLVEILTDPDKNGVFKIKDPTKQNFIITTKKGDRTETQTYSLAKIELDD